MFGSDREAIRKSWQWLQRAATESTYRVHVFRRHAWISVKWISVKTLKMSVKRQSHDFVAWL
jgi:hypothetical protein